MKDHCSNEELSAYLDGESEEPERTEAHLQSCAECARALAQMQSLSANIGALPGVEADAFFAERVTARVTHAGNVSPAWRLWNRPRVALGLGFAAALLIGVFGYLLAAPAGHRLHPAEYEQFAASASPPIVPGESADPPAYTPEPESVEDVSPEDMIAELATTDWFLVLAASWDDNDDLDAMLESMDSDEAEAFATLAREYSEKDVTI